MSVTIDAAYFREKVRICLRLAEGLPWNSPARYQLLLMAEDFQLRELELDPVSLPTSRDVHCESATAVQLCVSAIYMWLRFF
jgi:hypothetical protein